MPKRIANVKGKIIESASILFSQVGYNNVKMEDIAVHSNISVGTLYNYYFNKKMLFGDVIERELNNLFAKILDLDSSKVNISINEVVTVLYDEINNIRGFGEGLFILSEEDGDKLQNLKKSFFKQVNKIIMKDRWNKKSRFFYENNEKVILLILLAIIKTGRIYPKEREKNIDFISKLISKLEG